MTLILSEDNAIRKHLQGMIVTDQKAEGDGIPRQVGVFFGQPDQEIRNQSYPYITIDMIDMQRDTQREMRGLVKPVYMADPTTIVNADGDEIPFDPEIHSWEMDMPIPAYITYQVTSYARHPYHDRAILAQLLTTKLPRFGYLEIVESDVIDGDIETITTTMRRMDLLSTSKRDATEQAKRLFVNALTVRVFTEIPQGKYREIYKVQTADVSITDYPSLPLDVTN